MTPKPNGRKYTLTRVGLAMTGAPVLALFILAGLSKVSAEVASVVSAILPAYYLAIGALVTGFNASNAYISGKGSEPRTEGGPG